MKYKKVLLLLLTAVLLLLMVSCSDTTTTSTSTSPSATQTSASPSATQTSTAPTTTTQTTSEVEPIILRWSEGNPEQTALGQIHVQWAKMIEENSNGRIKVELYFSGALASQAERFRSTETGIADISYYACSIDRSLTPLSLVTSLPFVGMPADTTKATAIWWDLYNTFPEIQEEWESIVIVSSASMSPTQLHLTNKEARTPDDIDGMKIISTGEQPLTFKAMGAVPVDLGVGDWYTSLDRGLVEGIMNHFTVIDGFRLLELLPYHTFFGDEGATIDMSLFIMNKDKWESLPEDLQQVIIEAGEWQQEAILESDISEIQRLIGVSEDAGDTFSYLTEEEIQQWKDVAKVAHEEWIAENEAKGLPAREVYDELLRLIEHYKNQ